MKSTRCPFRVVIATATCRAWSVLPQGKAAYTFDRSYRFICWPSGVLFVSSPPNPTPHNALTLLSRPKRYCHPSCQNSIDVVYSKCDEICLPTNYYFDVAQMMTGCWRDVKDSFKIQVERCGCSAAGRSSPANLAAVAFAIFLTTMLIAR